MGISNRNERSFETKRASADAQLGMRDAAAFGCRLLPVILLFWAPAPVLHSVFADDAAKVIAARSLSTQPDRVGVDEVLIVRLDNLDALLQEKPILLYLNGKPVPTEEPHVHEEKGELVFRLTDDHSESAKLFWTGLMQPVAFTRPLEVTVGPAGGPLRSVARMTLVVLPVGRFCLWLVLSILGVGLIVVLGRNTNMLRRVGTSEVIEGMNKSYSLSRTQMTFWFVVIVSAFGFVWLVTGQTDTLTASVVALSGISAGTGLGAVTVDASKRNATAVELANLKQQMSSLETSDILDGTQQARLTALREQVGSLSRKNLPPPSVNFWTDILSDVNGISLHRLQLVVWTIVLGIVFVQDVYEHLSMPEFDSTLLALMGVSSGTYVGFKFPEQKK